MLTEDYEQAQYLSSQVEQARQRAVLAASDSGASRDDARVAEQQAREHAKKASQVVVNVDQAVKDAQDAADRAEAPTDSMVAELAGNPVSLTRAAVDQATGDMINTEGSTTQAAGDARWVTQSGADVLVAAEIERTGSETQVSGDNRWVEISTIDDKTSALVADPQSKLASEGDIRWVTKLGADNLTSELIASPSSETAKIMNRTINASIDNSKNPSLGLFHASLGLCHSKPLRIVTVGSSTTAGYGQDPADWWVSSLLNALQSNYAIGPGAETVVGTLDTTPSQVPGVHLHNGGISNTTSANYLTDAMVSKIGVIQPTLITHMIGSNDAKNGMSPTQYRSNLIGWLDKLDTAVTTAHTHVLIHAHERSDVNISAIWMMYREVLRTLALERSNVVFVDVSEDFRSLGIPGSDPLGLRHNDKIHLTPLGSDHLGRAIGEALGVPRMKSQRQLSAVDTFSRADGPLGVTDTGQSWVVTRGGVAINSGKAAQTAANLVCLYESGLKDVDVSCSMIHGGEVNSLAGVIFAGTDDGTWLSFLLNAGASKDVAIYISVAGVLTKIAGATLPLGTGTFELRAVKNGNVVHGYVDGELVLTHRLTRARMVALGDGSKVGFRSALQIGSLRWDNIKARAL